VRENGAEGEKKGDNCKKPSQKPRGCKDHLGSKQKKKPVLARNKKMVKKKGCYKPAEKAKGEGGQVYIGRVFFESSGEAQRVFMGPKVIPPKFPKDAESLEEIKCKKTLLEPSKLRTTTKIGRKEKKKDWIWQREGA